jgi:hypothetical protein
MDEGRMRRDNDVQALQVLTLFSLALTDYPPVDTLGDMLDVQYNNASTLQRKTARADQILGLIHPEAGPGPKAPDESITGVPRS